MRFLNAALACLAGSTVFVVPARATTLLAAPSAAMATDQSFSRNFNCASASGGLSFIIDDYRSLDGNNAY